MANINLDAFDKIIVLDFGSQYNQLITRRLRDFGIYSELLSHKLTADEIKEINPKGIIFSGGPNSVYDPNAFKVDLEIFKLGIPILGICYGMQLMALTLGGNVACTPCHLVHNNQSRKNKHPAKKLPHSRAAA